MGNNDLFQTEREETGPCNYTDAPNSITDTDEKDPVDAISSIEKFTFFMRFLAPPTPSPDTPGGAPSIANGAKLFQSVGCAYCHTPSFTTANRASPRSPCSRSISSPICWFTTWGRPGRRRQSGGANGREYRTAPLWGLGQRIFFLHDGRTSDLAAAIQAHASRYSEANGAVSNYQNLTTSQKQDVLNFLRSL